MRGCRLLTATLLFPLALPTAITPALASGPQPPPDPAISMTTVGDQSAQEGGAIGPVLAMVHDPDTNAAASDYTGSVNWGDGSAPVAVTLVQTAPGEFQVTATPHAYADAGSYFVGFDVIDRDNRLVVNRASGNFTAMISEAPLSAYGTMDAGLTDYCGGVAHFTDENPLATSSEFTDTIDWGDGSRSSGTITGSGTGPYWVQSCHTYTQLGVYTVKTTIADDALTVSATTTLFIYALTSGGTFVIGDGSAVGHPATFWGARWAEANPLSGGAASGAFKGFADGTPPMCSGTWSAGPGESSHPPTSVPAFTAVLVTSSVSADGPQVEGNSIHVDIVQTSSGYAPDPGNAGTGTVLFQAC